MISPTNPPLVVPFEGKTYNCDLTLGSIPAIENELNIGILCPEAGSMWAKPEFFKRTVLLYCLLKSKTIPGLTFERCAAATTGPDAIRLSKVIGEAAERMQPHLMRINGLDVEEEPERPTDAPSSGSDSGQSES